MFRWLSSRFGKISLSEARFQAEKQRILAASPIPVFWLFGKTGSGKSSVIRYLTGAEAAEIGNGFQPQTATSRQFDFPSQDNPVLRFLDTRGLAEGSYDPSEDLSRFNDSTHVMVVTVRVTDFATEAIVAPLRRFREAQPHRPVVLALTCLHEAYPGQQHPVPDPFAQGIDAGRVPAELSRLVARQETCFRGLVDRVVPLDLTKPDEGFQQPDFGGDRLKATLLELLPAAYRQTFLNLSAAMGSLKNLNERRAMPYVIGYSTLAATAAAVPFPWIDIPVVLAIQSHLVYRLRAVYGQEIDAAVSGRLAALVSGRLATALVLRETLKLIPLVGAAANAAFAYAYTYGLGKTCCWYFGQVRAGNAPSDDEVRRVWREQLSVAARSWSEHWQAAQGQAGQP